ncbi:MAG: protein translocase subunit SecD, partial [Phycicoccus sp.]
MGLAQQQRSYARRALIALGVMSAALLALLAGGNQWSDAQWTPKLGLDLEGGTQIVLEPRVSGGGPVSAEQLSQARDII